jgi:hypothetical protein
MTNITDKNSNPFRAVAQSQIEPTSTDTNTQGKLKQYQVHLFWTHTDEAFLTITAKSQKEAERKADEIESDILTENDLNPVSGEIDIDSVTPIEEEPHYE